MNKKLNIDLGEKYVIEVNDKGDTVVIYLEDTNLPVRFLEAYENVNKGIEKAQRSLKRIQAMDKGEKYNDIMSKAEYESMVTMTEMFDESRKAINTMLGDDQASQKLFGDVNSIDAFNDFFEQFEPIMQDIFGKQTALLDQYKDKYKVDESDILE